jgi:Spy/CpxP family protein refolding chaperone
MKLQKYSNIGLSLALCLGLSTAALSAHAQEASAPSASNPDAGQPGGDKAAGMQHHPHGKDYKGHHGMGGQGGMHHGMNGDGRMGMPRGPEVALDLDESQLDEIAQIQKELRSELSELKVQRYEESLKLQELYAQEELDSGDIIDQQQKVFDAIKGITELQVEAQQDIRDLLTSEQKNKVLRSGDWIMPN